MLENESQVLEVPCTRHKSVALHHAPLYETQCLELHVARLLLGPGVSLARSRLAIVSPALEVAFRVQTFMNLQQIDLGDFGVLYLSAILYLADTRC